MRILFDTNIVLDVLLDREPFVEPAAHLLARVHEGALVGSLCATTLTTISYIVEKNKDRKQALLQIRNLLALFEIAPVGRAVLTAAAESGFSDYEDGVLHEAARGSDQSGIVTRDADDFTSATLTVYTPKELLSVLDVSDENV